nr:hypothetical protein CFP56_61658 [Quercus suber]
MVTILPGYDKGKSSVEVLELEMLQSLSPVVISFFCDAISTIGNNLFKFWEIVKHNAFHSKGAKDVSPTFNPLVICVLRKCLRLLTSESGSFTLPEKSIISLYVDAGFLSALVESVLSERFGDCSVVDDSGDCFCDCRPLNNLLLFSRSVSLQQTSCIFSTDRKAWPIDSSFASTHDDVKKILRAGDSDNISGITKAFSSSIICTSPDEILKNFPSVMAISHNLLGVPMSILSSVFFLEQNLLTSISKLWPDMFFPGLETTLSVVHCEVKGDDANAVFGRPLDSQEIVYNGDLDASESVAAVFSLFLKQAPFRVLFPAIINISGPYLLEPLKIQDMLLAKLSDSITDCHSTTCLQLVLF